jgi:AcrR family transcriptional regulator
MAVSLDAVSKQIGTVRSDVRARFGNIEQRLATIEKRLEQIDQELHRSFRCLDERLQGEEPLVAARGDPADQSVDSLQRRLAEGFGGVEERLSEQRASMEFSDERLESAMSRRFDRLERKLDHFIEAQFQATQVVERRLRGLEPGEP